MVVGTMYQVTYTSSEKRSLVVVAKHTGMATSQLSLLAAGAAITIDQSAVTHVTASVLAANAPTESGK